ncbi:MAG: TIM barrel protein [Acidobacteria bacterium]|nr:TIM barrel protein [Acidobacteriota bacterium]
MATKVCLVSSLLAACLANAQSTTHLGGTVHDTSGALLPDVDVVCRSERTGLTRTTKTNQAGIFRFAEIPIGVYELVLTHQGFQTVRQGEIQLVTAQIVDLNITMQVGQVTESVGVTAEVPLVQTASASLQASITQRQMQDLPLNGRNPLQLVALTAGAVITRTGTVGGQQDNEGLSVNGQRVTQNNFRLDGSNYTNRYFNSVPVMPNPDTLEEFTVQSGNYSARTAGSGAVVELSTRSGSNEFHWSLFEFLRNTKLNARNFFQLQRPPFKLNQFGGAVGGPIRRDRTFFFASYQRTAQRSSPSSILVTTPTEAQRRGDFSRVPNPIIDPLTRQQFPGNIIPANRIDPIAAAILDRFVPLPNRGDEFDSLQNQDVDDHLIAHGDLLDGVMRTASALGAQCLVLSGQAVSTTGDVEAKALRRKADALNRVAENCEALNLRLAYHNHHFEFESNGAEMEALLEQTQTGLVWLLMDAGHVYRSRVDFASFFQRHQARICGIHLRDFRDDEQVILGQGAVNLGPLAQAIEANKWRGWLLAEEERLSGLKLGEVAAGAAREHIRRVFGI